jgi:hypothetical protein
MPDVGIELKLYPPGSEDVEELTKTVSLEHPPQPIPNLRTDSLHLNQNTPVYHQGAGGSLVLTKMA